MNEAFALVVRFSLKEGAEAAFDELVGETVQQVRLHEPGTLVYAVHRPERQPGSRLFYELYRDRAAFADHESQPHTRRFLEERERYIDRLEVTFLSPLVVSGPHLWDQPRDAPG